MNLKNLILALFLCVGFGFSFANTANVGPTNVQMSNLIENITNSGVASAEKTENVLVSKEKTDDCKWYRITVKHKHYYYYNCRWYYYWHYHVYYRCL